MANQTIRVFELLKRFNNGEQICIEALSRDSMWLDKDEKTIRRDLDIIKKDFSYSLELIRGGKGEKGCYKAITKDIFDNFINNDLLAFMVQTFNLAQRSNLFETFDITNEDKRILEKMIKRSHDVYEFKNKPFETKKDDHIIFKALEDAIRLQRYITLEYKEKESVKNYLFKPYKIIFMNEIFYLAGVIDASEFEFTLFRISKIVSVDTNTKKFQKNYELEDFIKDMQTPFARYTQGYRAKLIDVKLEVLESKAYFFKAKQFLKSQKILETKENGNLIISYKVSSEFEIEELIKRWLPYIKVLEPISLKNKINQELQDYLNLSCEDKAQ